MKSIWMVLCMIAGMAVGSLSASQVDAATVWNNGTPTGGGRNCVGYICADDFQFGSTMSLTGATFYGFTYSGQTATGSIDYYIYTDDGTGPGTVLASGTTNVVQAAAPSTYVSASGFNLLSSISVTFSSAFNAAAGQHYWIGFNGGTLGYNLANVQYGPLDEGQQCYTGQSCPADFFQTVGFAFELQGAPVGAVPLPAGALLLSTALLGFAAVSRRKKPAA